MFDHHFEYSDRVEATPALLFDHLDRHERLSVHMSRSSWMMGGGRMTIELDALQGRAVGSRIRLAGQVLGIHLLAEEVVTERDPPRRKAWETTGEVRLLVIGPYRMGFEITKEADASRLTVFIDYRLPERGVSRLLGLLLGGWYARWCTRRMVTDAARAFDMGARLTTRRGRR